MSEISSAKTTRKTSWGRLSHAQQTSRRSFARALLLRQPDQRQGRSWGTKRVRGDPNDRQEARHRVARDAAQVGPAGRGRRRHATGQDDAGAGRDPGVEEGDRRTASGERDPQDLLGFLRGGARPPVQVLIDYIDEHREEFGVGPICRVLSQHGIKIAPSTYYEARNRKPSKRALRDAERTPAATPDSRTHATPLITVSHVQTSTIGCPRQDSNL